MRITSVVVSTLLLIFLVGLASSANPGPSQGRAIVEKMGCAHCHIIEGRGGTVAPPLDGIAAFRDKTYIINRLSGKDVPIYPLPEELMSHIHVPAQDAHSIADYLLTLRKTQFTAADHGSQPEDVPSGSQFQPGPQSESSRLGAQMFKDLGCMACHSVGSMGGHVGPGLAGVGARRSQNYIKSRILSGAVLLPPPGAPGRSKYAMPPQELCEPHLQQLIDFLMTLPPDSQGKPVKQGNKHSGNKQDKPASLR